MPHFILEHSANLNADELRLSSLFEKLHNAANGTGLFPLAGIRSRAHRCEDYRLADGNPEYAFVHLHTKVGHGRTQEQLSEASQLFFDIVSEHFEEQSNTRGFALSFELTELPTTLKFNKNNLRNYLQD